MSRLSEIAESIEQQSKPPVHLWKPNKIGEIDIRINAQGVWFHEGDAINRESLVKLFASILWFENDKYYLVTPVEKLQITVEDVPFVIQQMEHVGDVWVAATNLHERVIISDQQPVKLCLYQQQWIPYVNVRYDLWARVSRSIYYQWVSAAMDLQLDANNEFVINSGEYRFEVARVV